MEIFASVSFDLHLFQVTVADRGLMKEHQRAQVMARQNSAAQWKPQQNASEWSCSVGAQVQLPADGKKCLSFAYFFEVPAFTQTWQSWPMTCLHPVRDTSVCFGGAPYSQCCSGKQLWGLCGGGRTEWQCGTIHRQSAQLIPEDESLQPVNTPLNSNC